MPAPYIDFKLSEDPNFPAFKTEYTSALSSYRTTKNVFKYSGLLNTSLLAAITALNLSLKETGTESDVLDYIKIAVAFGFVVINSVSGIVKTVKYPHVVSLAKIGITKNFLATTPEDLEMAVAPDQKENKEDKLNSQAVDIVARSLRSR